jgi:hypothetical protein
MPACSNLGYTLGFFNGVFTSELDANIYLRRIYELEPNVLNGRFKGYVINAKLFYNQTGCAIDSNGRAITSSSGCLQDLAEVFIQRAHEGDSSGATEANYTLFWDSLSPGRPLLTALGRRSPSMSSFANRIISGVSSFMGSSFLKPFNSH